MIWTAINRWSRQHIGIVNEPYHIDALRAARAVFGNKWFKGSYLSPEAVEVIPGETQEGLEGR